jgi:hypothetical protein
LAGSKRVGLFLSTERVTSSDTGFRVLGIFAPRKPLLDCYSYVLAATFCAAAAKRGSLP